MNASVLETHLKLDHLGDALQQIKDGSTAASLEGETLDFKRDPHTVTGQGLGVRDPGSAASA